MHRYGTALLLLGCALTTVGCGGESLEGEQAQVAATPGPLATALQKRAEASAAKMPDDLKALFARAAKELADTGILEQAKGVGAAAPDVTFEDASGQRVLLSNLCKSGPVVLAFYRGKW